jgi:hypothetical protein
VASAGANASTPSDLEKSPGLQWLLAVVSVCILVALVAIMTWALHWQLRILDLISESLLNRADASGSSLLLYVGIANFAVLKTCALCFAFVLIFLGSMYVLWPGRTPFALEAEQADRKASLKTSSPGLVMIALGVGLTAFVVFYKVNLAMSDPSRPVASTQEPLDANTPRTDLKESGK